MGIKNKIMYLCTLYLCAFSSARVVDSFTEASSLCIDGPLCASRGSSSLSRFVESIPEDTCPKFIIEQQVLRDQKISLTTDSPDEICSTSTVNNLNHFKNAGEFESYLQNNPFFAELNKKSGSTPPDFSSCLSQRVSVPVGLGKTALALSTKALPESKKKLAVAEYYSSLRRLSDGVERSLQNITAIDLMIGENSLLTDISCNSFDPLSGEVKSQCRSIKQCPVNNNSQLRESSKDTLLALQAIEAIDKEIRRLIGPRGNSRKNRKEIEELKERKKNLQNLYPWIVGKVFKDTYDRDDYSNYAESSEEAKGKMENQMANLIKNQLTHTREKLKERKEDFIKASSCIKGDEDLCNQLDMAKVLAKTPPINHDEVFERDRKKELKRRYEHEENLSPEERKEYREFLTTEEKREYRNLLTKVGEADGLFELAGCLQTQRKAVKEVSRELALGALDLGIVIGTMGLGSPYVAGRLAVRLGSAVSKATQAKNLSKAKRLQSLGIFGTDVSFSSPYMQEAMEACEDTLNQLEEMQTEEQTANAEKNNKLCENLPVRAKQTSDLKSCILQASLASLPITLPILGLAGLAVARGLGKASSSLPSISASKRAEEVLKTKLSPVQQRAVEEAHLVGRGEKGKDGSIAGIGNYTEDQLKRKADILKQAGFSRNQRRTLMEAGVVGDDILRRAEKKLKKALQKIRKSPEEPVLKAQGFKPEYYKGVDQAREFNAVARYLRTIKADPEKTHIPYFADQVEKTLADFEKGFRKHNQDNPELLEEGLKQLEALKKEARRRVADQNVTYDWWATFNLRLPVMTSEHDFIQSMLKKTLNTPIERQRAGIEIAYNKELAQRIKEDIDRNPYYPEERKAKFAELNPEDIVFKGISKESSEDVGKYTSQMLEELLNFDFYKTNSRTALNKVANEKGLYDISTVNTHEKAQEFFSDLRTFDEFYNKDPLSAEIDTIEFFNKTKESFPEEIMFFSTDELGIMPFNRLEDNSRFIGVSGSPVPADGTIQSPFNFFLHDLAHIGVDKDLGAAITPQKISKRISNTSSSPSDREKAELALFMYRHEVGYTFFPIELQKYYTTGETAHFFLSLSPKEIKRSTKKAARKMMKKNFYRFFDSDDLQGMLPESVNVNNPEAVMSYLKESADEFTDILLAH